MASKPNPKPTSAAIIDWELYLPELQRRAEFELRRHPGTELTPGDAVQQVYLRVHEAALDPAHNIQAYLNRTLRSVVMDALRRKQRRPGDLGNQDGGLEHVEVAEAVGDVESAQVRFRQTQVEQAFAAIRDKGNISAREWLAFELFHLQPIRTQSKRPAHEEVASAINVAFPNEPRKVKTPWVAQALHKIRSVFETEIARAVDTANDAMTKTLLREFLSSLQQFNPTKPAPNPTPRTTEETPS